MCPPPSRHTTPYRPTPPSMTDIMNQEIAKLRAEKEPPAYSIEILISTIYERNLSSHQGIRGAHGRPTWTLQSKGQLSEATNGCFENGEDFRNRHYAS